MKKNSLIQLGVIGFITASAVLAAHNQKIVEAASGTTPVTHIGTYDGSTTFTTSSANGVNPGLFIEVMDKDGNLVQYESEDGVITVENTKQGAYVTQAKLLGKTMYRDLDTGELLETWEEGRNLELESSKMPVLTTSNYKNLANDIFIDYGYISDGTIDNQKKWLISDFISIEPNVSYTTRSQGATNDGVFAIAFYDEDKTFISKKVSNSAISPTNAKFARINVRKSDGLDITEEEKNDTILYLEKTTEVLPFESHKTNILSTPEDLELRGIGDVKDTLDLTTGELTERIGEIVLDGSEDWAPFDMYDVDGYSTFVAIIPTLNNYYDSGTFFISADFATGCWSSYLGNKESEIVYNHDPNKIGIRVKSEKASNVAGIKAFLSTNNIRINYKLATESIKTVGLTADGYFAPETSAQVSIKGETVPLIASITVPTETLSFVIDPNQEVDQQFIAPEFTVTNDTYAPLKLEIKSFEQLTNGMNDVLPSKHSDWTTLGKQESNDIALALVPKAGSGWKSLIEGERYVADKSNYELGVINPAETVEFSFSALHGPTITKPVNLQYTLGLIFDFE